jgi:4-hydroxybenzoate polyprenyltransferase
VTAPGRQAPGTPSSIAAPAWSPAEAGALPDAVPRQLIFRILPAAAHPYLQLARIDRPIGWWLLLLPCWWSSALASVALGRAPNVFHILLFLIGAIAMRGAGSTYNDIIDREIDAKVERTRGRPLPSGRVTVDAAKMFLVAEALVGLAVLLSFNRFAIGLGFASLLVVGIYPFMKRLTSWPQAVLGLAFAWGGLMGWAAAFGALARPPLCLYLGAILWTIGYDTIYALQDIADDPAAGVKSTARLFATNVRGAVGALYAATVLCVETGLLLAGATGLFAQAGLVGFALHLAWQVVAIDPDDPRQAMRLFRSNRDAGLILFAGLAAEAVYVALR